jgi:hypothetical protein
METQRRWYDEEPATPEIEEGVTYTKHELEAKADAWLREDARSELCRECGERGETTGHSEVRKQNVKDKKGQKLALKFEQYACSNDHTWFEGEGKVRGIGGEDPILFEEHIQSRRRREIYTAVGTPDPEIVSGMYNRTHPQGRKVNSLEQRRKNGASYFR